MEARFRQLVLQLVDGALARKPNRYALLYLIQIAEPTLSDADLDDVNMRQSAFRNLLKLIHPDKHPNDSQRATLRTQEAHKFYDDCCVFLHGKKGKASVSPTSTNIPFDFHVQEKWTFLEKVGPQPVLLSKTSTAASTISKVAAFKCMNFRGAIAHGKKTELCYSYKSVRASPAKSVDQVFESLGGGLLQFDSVEDIKKEIMSRGPVVSTSFQLTHGFLHASEHFNSFEPTQVGNAHPILVVGWKLSAVGEMWLVRSITGNDDIPIAMGQFSIEDKVLAPKSDFDQQAWQDESRVFDLVDLSQFDWYAWEATTLRMISSELEALCNVIGCGLSEAFSTKKRFVLRDRLKKARSRWAILENVTWIESVKKWDVRVVFCD